MTDTEPVFLGADTSGGVAPPASTPPSRKGLKALRELAEAPGSAGLFPIFVMMLLAAAERLDMAAFGVLAPEIRSSFHLSNAAFIPLVTLTSVVPLLLAVPLGNWADRTN